MGSRHYNDDWDYYSDQKPKRVEGGLKVKKERGAIGETWWSKRWLAVLESFSMGTRLTRGRSYARQGQVISVDVTAGAIKAKVQGSLRQPYKVHITLKPLNDEEWRKVIEAMSAQALFVAKLLAGEMPTTIEEAFSSVHLSLFPTQEKDLICACSCPDWANPCKHTAAVYYILAEQFDADPFLLFRLRGRTKEAIIEALHKKRLDRLPHPPAIEAEPTSSMLQLEDVLTTFWQPSGDLTTFSVHPGKPAIDKAILKRLGESPYTIGGQNLATLLATIYDTVSTTLEEQEP